ncbi:IS30 family transposase [Asticcacaulis sp. AC466]|uniref:IS30 family transposase n=1 Tax=Asticcacaulis sp. AC466 TaxID=1282362 RepID=UPI00138AEA67
MPNARCEHPRFPIIGYEAIYQFIYSRAGQSLDLYKLLYRHRRRRRKRGGRKPAGSHIPLYCNIKHRPENIAKRDSFGHWEGDLIIFKREHGKKNLTSLVERKTRFHILLPNLDRKSVDIILNIAEHPSPTPHGRQTMTFDRGTELIPLWQSVVTSSAMQEPTLFCNQYVFRGQMALG